MPAPCSNWHPLLAFCLATRDTHCVATADICATADMCATADICATAGICATADMCATADVCAQGIHVHTASMVVMLTQLAFPAWL